MRAKAQACFSGKFLIGTAPNSDRQQGRSAGETPNAPPRQIDPPEYRLRVGDWRVRFIVRGNTVIVLRVLNRKDAYS